MILSALTRRIRGFITCAFFAVISFSVQAQSPQPNIIWIVCEDISPYIGAYGNTQLKTPNIDQLAKEGVRYTRAYTVAGVCAPSRSGIITGMYPTSIGTQHMRTIGDPKFQPVPSYSAVIPAQVRCFPEYLRKAGYYCTNNEKQDYQFIAPVTVWDENGAAASFRNRPMGKPFFSVFNLFITHESSLITPKVPIRVDSGKITVPPFYPDLPVVRHDMAQLFSNIEKMDEQVGEIIAILKQDGLYDNTIIFFYSDHGGALPWMKREVLERGTHIPLIIRFPGGMNAGTVDSDLVSSIDFAPSILSLAGIGIPAYMQGQAFLGTRRVKKPRQYVFAARDRMDTEYDRVRMVRDKRYRYLYNYMPEKTYYQNIEYRMGVPMMKVLLDMHQQGKLNPIQDAWFGTKPVEELYDVDQDPQEIHNLAADPKYAGKLKEMRTAFQQWTKKYGDMASLAEKEMIKKMWNGADEAPATAVPVIERVSGGVRITCATRDASIGYHIIHPDGDTAMHVVSTWDFGQVMGVAKNGTLKKADPVWTIYSGQIISIGKTDTLKVNAMRIGFKPGIANYYEGK